MVGTVPQKDADYLNKLIEIYIRKGLEEKNQKAKSVIEFIDKQLASISDSLKVTETNLQLFKQQNRSIDISNEAVILLTKLTELQKESGIQNKKLAYYKYLKNQLEDDAATTWNGNAEYIRFVKSLKSFENNHLLKILAIPILTTYPKKLRLGALKFLESLIFRYVVICQRDTKQLEEKLYSVAKKINDKTVKKYGELKSEFNEFIVDDEEFETLFAYRSLEYSSEYANPMVRYIIYKIENYLVGEERHIFGVSNASIEHIGSQSNTSISKVFRLGNYALLTREENSAAGNKDFVTKKEEYYKNSTFEITNGAPSSPIKSLASYNAWDIENINKRQMEMAKVATKVWKIS
jgi:hypothetical protein